MYKRMKKNVDNMQENPQKQNMGDGNGYIH